MTIEGHEPGCDGRHAPRQECNSRGAAVATAAALDETLPEDEGAPDEAMIVAEDERDIHRARAVADGPLHVIDSTRIPALPIAAFGAVMLLAFVVVARLLRRRRSRP